MSTKPLRIVFMGTPEFAVASLDAVVKSGFDVVGVVTAPDRPAGRGLNLQQSAVKQYAVKNNLNVLQPEKLRTPEFISQLKELNADIQAVVAFRMLPEMVWNMPPLGTVNVHGSLLPKYRGAAPINWAIINGEKETGVTTFRLQHEIDTGGVLMQETISIGDDETAGELHDRMKIIGADLLVTTLKKIQEGSIVEKPQTTLATGISHLPHAPKIFTDTCRINFGNNVYLVHNLIRGLSPFPGAFTSLNNKLLKIYRSSIEVVDHGKHPGEFVTDQKTWLKFACADGFVSVKELQVEGKKRMSVEEFLRGNKLFPLA